MWSDGPFIAGQVWPDWVAVSLVIIALWAVPIAGTLALFPSVHCDRRDRRHRNDG
jgi:hypothetical protein